MPKVGRIDADVAIGTATQEADANLIPDGYDPTEGMSLLQAFKANAESVIQTVFFSDLFETNVFSGQGNPYVQSWLTAQFYPEYEAEYWRWMARKWRKLYIYVPPILSVVVLLTFLNAVFVFTDSWKDPTGETFITYVVLNTATLLIIGVVWVNAMFLPQHFASFMRWFLPVTLATYTLSALVYDNCAGRYSRDIQAGDSVTDSNVLYFWIPFIMACRWTWTAFLQLLSAAAWLSISLTHTGDGLCRVNERHRDSIFVNLISLAMAFIVGTITNIILESYFRKLYLVDLAVKHRDQAVPKEIILQARQSPFPANVKNMFLTFRNPTLEQRYRQFF